MKEMTIVDKEKILDIGCGVGDYTKAVCSFTSNVVGLDISVVVCLIITLLI